MDEQVISCRTTMVFMFDCPDDNVEAAKERWAKFYDQVKDLFPDEIRPYFHSGRVETRKSVKKNKRDRSCMVVAKTITADEGLAPGESISSFKYSGLIMTARADGPRLRCLKKNRACVACGIVGTEMRLERHENDFTFHWNLYGLDGHGHWVMLTVDHITPRSKGGPDHPKNYQTLCSRCNSIKGSDILSIDELRDRLGIATMQLQSGRDGMDVAMDVGDHPKP